MTAALILSDLRTRGIELVPQGTGLRCRGPKGALTPQLRQALTEHKPELLRLLTTRTIDNEPGMVTAAKLTGTPIGDVWLIADTAVLTDEPHIIRSGLPLFFFDEVEQLRGKTPAELRAIGILKVAFPTSRVLQ